MFLAPSGSSGSPLLQTLSYDEIVTYFNQSQDITSVEFMETSVNGLNFVHHTHTLELWHEINLFWLV